MAAASGGLSDEREPEARALSFEGRELSRRFERHEVVIEAGRPLAYDAATWAGALVVVEEGALLVACTRGRLVPFATAAILTLDRLPIVELRSQDERRVRLSLVRRSPRPTAEPWPS